MDPITLAVVAALGVGIGIDVIKAAVHRVYGQDHDVEKAIAALEQKPGSEGRRQTLHEEVVAVGAEHNAEVLNAVDAVMMQVQARPGAEQLIAQITGGNVVQGGVGHNIGQATGSDSVAIGQQVNRSILDA